MIDKELRDGIDQQAKVKQDALSRIKAGKDTVTAQRQIQRAERRQSN